MKFKMKIAILTMFYPPFKTGGTEIASREIYEELKKKNFVQIITSKLKIKKIAPILFLIKSLFLLKVKKFDSILCMSTFPAIAPLILRKDYFVYCRGTEINQPTRLQNKINHLVLKRARKIFSLTLQMREIILKKYQRESIVIPNGIKKIIVQESKPELRKNLNLNLKKTIGIYIGTLKEVKGIEYLINALTQIKEANLEILILGKGPKEKELKKMSNDLKIQNIKFLGEITHPKVYEYLKASDMLILPSLSEGLSNVLLEGLSQGIPIITTNVGGNPEIVIHNENGFIVQERNSKAISDAIKKMIVEKELRKRISKNNLKRSKDFSWEKTSLKIVENLNSK